ncbi:MAG TPA: type II secretion system F family protein [Burkholderiales bacterium]|jgi:general secretion pathway protein F
MLFQVKTIARNGAIGMLAIEAATQDAALERAAADGLGVLSIKGGSRLSFGKSRGGRFPLLQFAQELNSLLESGVTLLEAIETLAEKEEKPAQRDVYQRFIADLRDGRSFSTALESQPQAIPPLFVASVRASERTGNLPDALARFSAYQTQVNLVRGKLVSAAIYPLLLLFVGGLVILFLMIYVVPRFAHIYEDIGGDLPFMSRLLLDAGSFMGAHGIATFAVAAVVVSGLVTVLRSRKLRAFAGQQVWRIQVVSRHLKVYQLARFFRTVGMLIRGGVAMVTALEMSKGLLQTHLQIALEDAVRQVREGQSLSNSLNNHGLSTPVVARMLRVGEKSGEIGVMLERIAIFYDSQVERIADWITRLVSPVLMLAMGLVIGTVVVLMYLPIFQLAEQIK